MSLLATCWSLLAVTASPPASRNVALPASNVSAQPASRWHVALPASNLSASADFYSALWPRVHRPWLGVAGHWFALGEGAGSGELHLIQRRARVGPAGRASPSETSPPETHGVHASIPVDSTRRWAARLRALGIPIMHARQRSDNTLMGTCGSSQGRLSLRPLMGTLFRRRGFRVASLSLRSQLAKAVPSPAVIRTPLQPPIQYYSRVARRQRPP